MTEVASSSYSPRTKMGEDHWTDTNHKGSLLVVVDHAWSCDLGTNSGSGIGTTY